MGDFQINGHQCLYEESTTKCQANNTPMKPYLVYVNYFLKVYHKGQGKSTHYIK